MNPLTSLPKRVTVIDVAPRDGLQNEPTPVPTEVKIRFIEALADAGVPVIEVTSFVRPDLVPQLSDAEALLAQLPRRPGVRYPVLVLNPRGLERAIAAGATDIGLNVSATDRFNQVNLRRSTAEVLAYLAPMVQQAKASGCQVRGYVSTAFGCPFTGRVTPEQVLPLVDAFFEMGCDDVSIGDTIGVATPDQIAVLLEQIGRHYGLDHIGLHLHDTRGTALANVLTGLMMGVTTIDASAGGIGGCPFAPGAAGNLATEDLVYMLDGLGVETGIDLERVRAAAREIEQAIGRPLPGKVYRAGPAPAPRD